MKSIPIFALIFLISLLVATIVGWRVAEYALLSSRSDTFLLMGGIFAGLFISLSLIYVLIRR
jgi:hypothetical protein